MKRYIPVGNFERQTSHCPTYIAWHVLDEARDYFRESIPDAYAARLAQRAEAVFARHPSWEKRYRSPAGRDYILMSMRHWLSSLLARQQPALFRQLPESFMAGHPLPARPAARSSQPAPHVHGAEHFTCYP